MSNPQPTASNQAPADPLLVGGLGLAGFGALATATGGVLQIACIAAALLFAIPLIRFGVGMAFRVTATQTKAVSRRYLNWVEKD